MIICANFVISVFLKSGVPQSHSFNTKLIFAAKHDGLIFSPLLAPWLIPHSKPKPLLLNLSLWYLGRILIFHRFISFHTQIYVFQKVKQKKTFNLMVSVTLYLQSRLVEMQLPVLNTDCVRVLLKVHICNLVLNKTKMWWMFFLLLFQPFTLCIWFTTDCYC